MAFGAGSYPEPPDEGRINTKECPCCCGTRKTDMCLKHNKFRVTEDEEEDMVRLFLEALGEKDDDALCRGNRDSQCLVCNIECPVCKGEGEVQVDSNGEASL